MKLEAGLQVFHNGVPVQLLYRTEPVSSGERWRVKPLFVNEPERTEFFCDSDSYSLLHTIRGSKQ